MIKPLKCLVHSLDSTVNHRKTLYRSIDLQSFFHLTKPVVRKVIPIHFERLNSLILFKTRKEEYQSFRIHIRIRHIQFGDSTGSPTL